MRLVSKARHLSFARCREIVQETLNDQTLHALGNKDKNLGCPGRCEDSQGQDLGPPAQLEG